MYFGFYCIILYFTQRMEFVVFIKSVCFGTLIFVENSHFNEYSVFPKKLNCMDNGYCNCDSRTSSMEFNISIVY